MKDSKIEKPKIEDVIIFAKEAGEFLLDNFRKTKLMKREHGKDVKTIYDLASERLIKRIIMKEFPEHSILAEETGFLKRNEDYIWIIDPLDGTSNFINSNPFFSVSIAFAFKEKLELSVVYAPFLKEIFIAQRNKGAYRIDLFRNKKIRINVSETSDLNKSYIVTCEGGEKDRKRVSEIRRRLISKAIDVRKLGSGALECAWVACGRSDAFVTTKISSWDVAAGILLVEEAGGSVKDFSGGEWKIFSSSDLIVSNGKIEKQLLNLLRGV